MSDEKPQKGEPTHSETAARALAGERAYDDVDAFGRPVEGELAAAAPKTGGERNHDQKRESEKRKKKPSGDKDDTSERPPRDRIEHEAAHGAP